MLVRRITRLFCMVLAAITASAALPVDASIVRYFSARRSIEGVIVRGIMRRTEYTEGSFASEGFGPAQTRRDTFIAFDFDTDAGRIVNYHIDNGNFVLNGDRELVGSNGVGGFDYISTPVPSGVLQFRLISNAASEARFYFRRVNSGISSDAAILSFTSIPTATGGRLDFVPFDPDAPIAGGSVFDIQTLQSIDVQIEANTLLFSNPNSGIDMFGGRMISGPTESDLMSGGPGGSEIFMYGIPLDAGPGDYNNDGVVDVADYTVWRDIGHFLPGPDPYGVWVANYGKVYTQSATVPEPTSLLVVACLGLLWSLPRSGTALG